MAEGVETLPANDALPVAVERRSPIKFTNLAAAVADGMIVVAWCGGEINTLNALGAHVLAASVLCGAMALLRRRQYALHLQQFLMLMVLGPLGGWVLLIMDLGQRLGAREPCPSCTIDSFGIEAPSRPRQAWAVFAALRQGRRPVPSHSRPSRFVDIFESGDLTLQNAAIAAISRRYTPEMLPALMAALNSPVPAVRVQAAAVYAKLRTHYGERAKALLAATKDGADERAVATIAAEYADLVRSGFLDAVAVANLRSRAEALACLDECCPRDGQGPAGKRIANAPGTPLAPHRTLKRYACGGVS